MVAQVIAAPVMMIGNVATAVVKTASTIAMKAGSAAAKATMSVAKTAGSALKTSLMKSVTTAGKASKGLLSSIKSSPLTSRFSALGKARGGAARAAARSPARPMPKQARRTPVYEAVQRGVNRSAARQRMQKSRQGHAMDDRDRMVMRRIMQVDGEQENQVANPFLEMARAVKDKTMRAMSAVRKAAFSTPQNKMAMQIAQKEHDEKSAPAMQR